MKNVEKRNNTAVFPPRYTVFWSRANWSGGGERAGLRNNGNYLRLQRNSGRSKMADSNELLLLYVAFSFEDLLLNGNF